MRRSNYGYDTTRGARIYYHSTCNIEDTNRIMKEVTYPHGVGVKTY